MDHFSVWIALSHQRSFFYRVTFFSVNFWWVEIVSVWLGSNMSLMIYHLPSLFKMTLGVDFYLFSCSFGSFWLSGSYFLVFFSPFPFPFFRFWAFAMFLGGCDTLWDSLCFCGVNVYLCMMGHWVVNIGEVNFVIVSVVRASVSYVSRCFLTRSRAI